MSFASFARVAGGDSGWTDAWDSLSIKFRNDLIKHELADPIVWAGMRGDRNRLVSMFTALGCLATDPADLTEQLDGAERLQKAARPVGAEWTERTARISNANLAAEVSVASRKRKTLQDDQDLQRLCAPGLLLKPTEWRGKKYRRVEVANDENGRRKAEQAERDKWARKVIAIIVQARLPFGIEIHDKGIDALSPEAGRCLRG